MASYTAVIRSEGGKTSEKQLNSSQSAFSMNYKLCFLTSNLLLLQVAGTSSKLPASEGMLVCIKTKLIRNRRFQHQAMTLCSLISSVRIFLLLIYCDKVTFVPSIPDTD